MLFLVFDTVPTYVRTLSLYSTSRLLLSDSMFYVIGD